MAVTIHLQRLSNDEHLRRAFVFFDKDESGYIEFEELREALKDESGEADTEVVNDILREVDTDKVHILTTFCNFSTYIIKCVGSALC